MTWSAIVTAAAFFSLIPTTTLPQARSGESRAPRPPHVSCLATNHSQQTVSYDHATKKTTEVTIDDWYVRCSIIKDDKKVYDEELELVHPTTFAVAMAAIDDFRTHKAAEILYGKKRGK